MDQVSFVKIKGIANVGFGAVEIDCYYRTKFDWTGLYLTILEYIDINQTIIFVNTVLYRIILNYTRF